MKKLYSQNWSQPNKCQSSNAEQEVTEERFQNSLCIVHANASTAV
jgi:hypothetical protein